MIYSFIKNNEHVFPIEKMCKVLSEHWKLLPMEKKIITAGQQRKKAIKNRNIEEGFIFHSDIGVQYASKTFVNVLDSYKK